MKKKLKKSKVKRLTEEQQQRRDANKVAQKLAREALGFDKMKITGVKKQKFETGNPCNEISLGGYQRGATFIGFSQNINYTAAQLQQIYAQTHLNP